MNTMDEQCKKHIAEVNKLLSRKCKKHKNKLSKCEKDQKSCSCADGNSNKVDLVILIDSSTTMAHIAKAVNDAANAGLQAAQQKCKADVRVEWFWVDILEPGSSSSHGLGGAVGNFTESHQVYLENKGITGPFYHDQIDAVTSGFQPYEKGAAAIADISEFFDWRESACRSIFYISDTKLAGYGSNATQNDIAVNLAISIAKTNNVSVFAHRADPSSFIPPMTIAQVDSDYDNLCLSTGGQAENGGAATVALYTKLIAKAVCECKHKCIEVKKPNIKPCISISWGRTACDGLESSDCQTFCIKVCNCYSIVSFCNFIISKIRVTNTNGTAVSILPNGDPVIDPIPLGPICFGDIGPCKKGNPNCVSREFIIMTSGAKPGNYQIHLEGVCFGVKFQYEDKLCYNLEIC